MKNILLILTVLLTSFNSLAQDPQLFENDWYLQKVVIDDEDFFPPNNSDEPITGTITFMEQYGMVGITFCDSASPEIEYNPNGFLLEEDPIFLVGLCFLFENMTFSSNYFSVFYTNSHIAINPFNYIFTTENDHIVLTVINADGNKAIFINELLSNQDIVNRAITVFPNPVKNVLQISTQSNINNIEVYDVMGKQLLEAQDVSEVDVSTLTPGLLFVKIETDKGVVVKKVVKE